MQNFRKIYNEELNLLPEERDAVIEEGREVFRLNDALVATVKGTDAWREASDSFLKKLGLIICIIAAMYFAWHVFSMGSGGVLEHGY